jgi:chromosome segregation ATPase
MSDEVDTDATSVTQIALSLEEMGDNIYYDAAAILRALAAERDTLRQRKRELLDRLAWVEGERISWRERAEKAEAEKKTYESGWLEAEGIISDLQERAEDAEAKRDEYHDIANAYAAWAGDILELLEERLGELDIDNPSDEALKRLMDRAEAGIASDVRAALRQDEGGDE